MSRKPKSSHGPRVKHLLLVDSHDLFMLFVGGSLAQLVVTSSSNLTVLAIRASFLISLLVLYSAGSILEWGKFEDVLLFVAYSMFLMQRLWTAGSFGETEGEDLSLTRKSYWIAGSLFFWTGISLKFILLVSAVVLFGILVQVSSSERVNFWCHDFPKVIYFMCSGALYYQAFFFLGIEIIRSKKCPSATLEDLPAIFFFDNEPAALGCLSRHVVGKSFTKEEHLYILLKLTQSESFRDTVLQLLREDKSIEFALSDKEKLERAYLRRAILEFYLNECSSLPIKEFAIVTQIFNSPPERNGFYRSPRSALFGKTNWNVELETSNVKPFEIANWKSRIREKHSARFHTVMDSLVLSVGSSGRSSRRIHPKNNERKAYQSTSLSTTERKLESSVLQQSREQFEASVPPNKTKWPDILELAWLASQNEECVPNLTFNKSLNMHLLDVMLSKPLNPLYDIVSLKDFVPFQSIQFSVIKKASLFIAQALRLCHTAETVMKKAQWTKQPPMPPSDMWGRFLDRKVERWYLAWVSPMQARQLISLRPWVIGFFLLTLYTTWSIFLAEAILGSTKDIGFNLETKHSSRWEVIRSCFLYLSVRTVSHGFIVFQIQSYQQAKFYSGSLTSHKFKRRAALLGLITIIYSVIDMIAHQIILPWRQVMISFLALSVAQFPVFTQVSPEKNLLASSFASLLAVLTLPLLQPKLVYSIEVLRILIVSYITYSIWFTFMSKCIADNYRLLFCQNVLPYLLYLDALQPDTVYMEARSTNESSEEVPSNIASRTSSSNNSVIYEQKT